jgi:hypothetical protein
MQTRIQARWLVHCVKCGFRGKVSDLLPAAPNAKTRWRKFIALVTCPSCGDSKGHCGILGGKVKRSRFPHHLTQPTSPPTYSLEDTSVNELIKELINELIAALDADATVEALQQIRGYDAQLARWLTDRGIRFGQVSDLRFKVSPLILKSLPSSSLLPDTEPCFWLPVVTYTATHQPTFVGLQVRRLQGEPRYLTVKPEDAPPVHIHIALPTNNREDGQRFSEVWVTEGILKAEVIAYKLGIVAIGALGAEAVRTALSAVMEAARRWHKEANLFNAPIVLAPDSDAKGQVGVAKAFWQLAKGLQQEGFPVHFALWPSKFKGVDDALLANEKPVPAKPEEWLASLSARVRNELLPVKVKTRMLLPDDIARTLNDLPTSPSPSQTEVAVTYEVSQRKDVWLQTLAENKGAGKTKVLMDASPAGSGKTFAAAQLKLKEMRQAGIQAKRVVYISPEVKRAPVEPLKRFRLFVGRDSLCSFWERLQVVEAEGLTKVGKRICAHCPVRKQCAYYAQKQSSGRRYWRISWQSYSPKEGDFIILDEFSRLPLWRDFAITPDQIEGLVGLLKDRPLYASSPVLDAFRWLQAALQQNMDLDFTAVAQAFSVNGVRPMHWGDFARALQTSLTDINQIRAWVFGQSPVRFPWLGWAQAIADIFRGHLTGQVWAENGTLKVKVFDRKVRDAVAKAEAILILDAAADPAEVERLLDIKVAIVKSDEPEKFPTVYQVPLGALSHRARPDAQRRWLWTAKQVVEALKRKGWLPAEAKVGVLTHKGAAPIAQQMFGKEAVVGWFGRDDRATNAFYDAGVQVLVVVGLPHRNIGSIAAERRKAGEKRRALRKARMSSEYWVVLKEFAKPDLAKAVRREAEIAYLQAAGRLRQGRRSEQCYMVVLDTEPLPEALNPIVLPPEKVLPQEVWQDWQRRRQRGAAVANALRQKAAAERLAKAAEAVRLYREVVGEDPKPAWLAQVLGVHRNWARKLLAEVKQTAHYICEKEIGSKDTDPETQMNCAVCFTLADAICAFISAGYPVPVCSLACKFGVSKAKVSRLARRLATEPPSTDQPAQPSDQPATISTEDWLASFSAPDLPTLSEPICPACGEPLEPEPDGTAACVGCGRVWRVITQGGVG